MSQSVLDSGPRSNISDNSEISSVVLTRSSPSGMNDSSSSQHRPLLHHKGQFLGDCVICLSAQVTIALLPCRHTVICRECLDHQLNETQNYDTSTHTLSIAGDDDGALQSEMVLRHRLLRLLHQTGVVCPICRTSVSGLLELPCTLSDQAATV
ncbi:unnamed protein product [Protopolystoma xenopodis]|uniref:RING-type domain-containing protein n=1 Tax=Protopolystoma xenopodis TaxID=117903 RepID=A0A448XJU5_9PLAT|nr:unnamed protein product [Protopolystoma xenopodis]